MTTLSAVIPQAAGYQTSNSTLEGQSRAANGPALSAVSKVKRSLIAFTWVFATKQVILKQKNDEFNYIVKDQALVSKKKAPIDFGDYTSDAETKRKLLVGYFPKIGDDENVQFLEPYVCQKNYFSGYKVKLLLLEGSEVYWEVIDKAAQKAFLYPFHVCSLTTYASRQTKRYFSTLNTRNEGEIALFLSEEHMRICYLGKQLIPTNLNLADVRLRPVSVLTKLDPNVLVSGLTFAVTLLAYSGSCKSTKCMSNNHAEILIEGIKKTGEQFAYIIHFVPPVVISDVTHLPKIKYFQRSKTWKVSSRKVEKMFLAAQQYVSQGLKFNKFGQRSVFWFLGGEKGGHSCLTFARTMFAILGIKIPVTPLDWIAPFTRLHTQGDKKFKKITDSCSDPKGI